MERYGTVRLHKVKSKGQMMWGKTYCSKVVSYLKSGVS